MGNHMSSLDISFLGPVILFQGLIVFPELIIHHRIGTEFRRPQKNRRRISILGVLKLTFAKLEHKSRPVG